MISRSYRYAFGSRQRPARWQLTPRCERACSSALASSSENSGPAGTGHVFRAPVTRTNGSLKKLRRSSALAGAQQENARATQRLERNRTCAPTPTLPGFAGEGKRAQFSVDRCLLAARVVVQRGGGVVEFTGRVERHSGRHAIHLQLRKLWQVLRRLDRVGLLHRGCERHHRVVDIRRVDLDLVLVLRLETLPELLALRHLVERTSALGAEHLVGRRVARQFREFNRADSV